jgi:hypothetical protein
MRPNPRIEGKPLPPRRQSLERLLPGGKFQTSTGWIWPTAEIGVIINVET